MKNRPPKCNSCLSESEFKQFTYFSYYYCAKCQAEVPYMELPELEEPPFDWRKEIDKWFM